MMKNVIEYSSSKEKQGETIMNMADIAPPGLSYNYSLDSIEIMYGWEDNYYLTTFDTFVEKIDHINPQVNIDLGDITTADGWVKTSDDVVVQIEGAPGAKIMGLDEFVSARGKLGDSIATRVHIILH